MKTIFETFEEVEFRRMKEQKKKLGITWKQVIMRGLTDDKKMPGVRKRD